jgi:hypothetical protein
MLLVAGFLPPLVLADESNLAGLVVEFGDGQVVTRCVTFDEDQISGAELLVRSGLQMVVDASSSMGLTVCQIEGEGCAYPAEACFCQCMGGGECIYWNYYYRDPGETDWIYSPLGAAARQVRHGSVEVWVWGDGDTPPASELSLAAICELPTSTPEPSATVAPTNTVGPADTVEPTNTVRPTQTAEPTNAVETPPSKSSATPADLPVAPTTISALAPTPAMTAIPLLPAPSPAAVSGTDLSSYWPFGLMILGLAVVGAILWLRSR